MLFTLEPVKLRRSIFRNRTDILNNLDIDDVREIFIEREIFSSSKFDEIEEKRSGSEHQMSAVLNEINNSGSHAMRTLVDVLYINQLDSLANSLVGIISKELQTWKKTHTEVRNIIHINRYEIMHTQKETK
jgi:hypothetical protein